MSDFFDSDIIQEELNEINKLQEKIYGSLFGFGMMDKEEKLEYFEALEKLIEKQKIFHARICLSDDPEAQSVAESIKKAVVLLGGNEELNPNDMFDELLGKVRQFKDVLESGTQD